MNALTPKITCDTLFNGRLSCKQFHQGYRFSVDAVLAAHFCQPAVNDAVLDLGCGCGIISLILAYRHQGIHVTGLELQPELADLARLNITDNGFGDRVTVQQGDICNVSNRFSAEAFDLVISNPPYREPRTGRISPADQRARARHEIDANLSDFVDAAAFGVKNRGRVVMVYPAKRLVTLITVMKRKLLEPKRIQPVYSYPESSQAVLALVEAVKNGGEEAHVMPPLYVYREKNGPYSDTLLSMYG